MEKGLEIVRAAVWALLEQSEVSDDLFDPGRVDAYGRVIDMIDLMLGKEIEHERED